jgi:LAO/AO transport system ATPase
MQKNQSNPIRIVLAKIGLDGHDRGIKVVARGLRDRGMEVIYTGLWQTPEAAVRAVEDEDADCLGVSLLSGAHMTLVPQLLEALRARNLDHVTVLVGGIIPEADVPALEEMGVAHVFGPGAVLEEIAQVVRASARPARQPQLCGSGGAASAAPSELAASSGAELPPLCVNDINELIAAVGRRDRRALAHLITLMENNRLGGDARSRLPSPVKEPVVLGITGSAGAGKSTLIAALVEHLRGLGQSVAVLACDPQSPVTGGALLGDRIRMRFEPDDEGVYFRSLSTRGEPGGMAPVVRDAVPLLAAFAFDTVIVETIGVGQDEVAVRDVADVLVLLVTPGTGDEVQWQKAGVIEVADIVLVNKADLPGADTLAASLRHVLGMAPSPHPQQVLTCTASRGEGVAELWQAVQGARASR